ncbi:unnamed protein product, partial [Effrenium voratum]
ARKELPFESVEAGISYLQLKADEEAAAKRKLGSAAVPATALKALQCPDGHPITRRGEPAKFFQDKRTCHVCGTGIGSVSTFWRCTKNCKYNVCHQCLQSAAQDAGQAQLEVPRSEAPSESIESDVFALEHTVYFEGRGRLWAFSLQLDFGPQLAELRSCFQAPDAVLLRCDGEVEVISSLQQLQAPDLSALHLEEPQPLLARVLAEPNLRQLLAILCAPELASEAFRQDGVRILVEVICVSDDDIELASKGLCALLHTDRDLATSHLKALWPEMGLTLMRRLLQRPEGASLAVTLWLVEALEEAAEAFAAAGESPHMAAPGYRVAAKLARRKPPEPTSPTPPTSPEKAMDKDPSVEEDTCESTRELLDILTASVSAPRTAATDQGKQLEEEKKYSQMLRQRLRQQHAALKAAAPLLRLNDAQLEQTLSSVIEKGWDSTDWPRGKSLLHFLCEHCTDARGLRFVAALCPDLEARDEQNCRAMDYALRNPNPQVVEALLAVSRERNCSEAPQEASFKVLEEVPDLEELPNLASLEQEEKEPLGRQSIGAFYLLQTKLAKVERENELLKKKVGEMESLRTRLAKMSEPGGSEDCSGLIPEPYARFELKELHELQRVSESRLRGDSQSSATSTADGASAYEAEEVASTSSLEPDDAAKSLAGVLEKEKPTSPTSAGSEASEDKSKEPEGKLEAKEARTEVTEAKTAEPLATEEKDPVAPEVKEAPKAPPKGKGKGKAKPPPAPADAGPAGDKEPKGKGKGKAAAEPTKPAVTPHQELKSVPWTRYIGAQIKEGTVWDQVNQVYQSEGIMQALPCEEIEKRFGKSSASKPKAPSRRAEKPKTVKLSSINQQDRLQLELTLRTLPVTLNTGAKAAMALQAPHVLSPEELGALKRLCPTAEQEAELRQKRQAALEDESFKWDPVEQYMEDLSQISGCAMRLSCWKFLYNLPERLSHLQENLSRFERMLHSFLHSKEIPFLLSLILAFGNYLNGGKNEKRLGRADGFHVELLGRPGGLDQVNDSQGRNVRQLIFDVYCTKYASQAEKLLEELGPAFALVQRTLGKDSQQVPQLRKSVRVQIEDLDKQLTQLKSEFSAEHQELKDCLKLIADPADKFVLEIPGKFEQAKQDMEELILRKDHAMQKFKEVLSVFKAETYRGDPIVTDGQVKDGNPKEEMTSEVWCKIWDDFFVPSERALSFDEKRQKELIEPRFCKEKPVSLESLSILWGLSSATVEKPRRSLARRRESKTVAVA